MALVMVDDGCKVEQKNFSLVIDEEKSISSNQFFTLGRCSLNLAGGFTHIFYFPPTWADDSFQMGGKKPPTRNVNPVFCPMFFSQPLTQPHGHTAKGRPKAPIYPMSEVRNWGDGVG